MLASFTAGVIPSTGNNLSIDSQGNLIAAGYFQGFVGTTAPVGVPLPALPSTGNTPPECIPGGSPNTRDAAYVMRINGQNGTILSAQVFSGSMQTVASTIDSQGNIYLAGNISLPDIPITPGVLYDPATAERTTPGAYLVRTSPSSAATPIGCVTDATNMTLIGPVAPGQLLTIYGNNIGPAQPAIGIADGVMNAPTSLAGVTVTFDGQPAPLLYVSSGQINVQAPYQIDDKITTTMQLSFNGSAVATRSFVVTPENPGIFIASFDGNLTCGNTKFGALQIAFAINEDGSLNSCSNPAKAGSQVSIFLNGLGLTAGNRTTGALTSSYPQNDFGSAAVFTGPDSMEVDSFHDEAGAISGIGQLTFRVPNNLTSLSTLGISASLSNLQATPINSQVAVFAAP